MISLALLTARPPLLALPLAFALAQAPASARAQAPALALVAGPPAPAEASAPARDSAQPSEPARDSAQSVAGDSAQPSAPARDSAQPSEPAQPADPAPAPVDPVPTPVAPSGSAPAEPDPGPVPEDISLAPDGPIAVSTRVTPDPSQIGDLIKLEVTAAYPVGYTVNVPLGLKLDPLHLVAVEESEPESTGQGLRKVFTFTLQHFDVGEARTPPFQLTYVAPDGAVHTVPVPAHTFTVSALLANEADPKRQGEDPPISLPYPNTTAETAIYYTAGALVVGFVSALLWMRWRRRPRPVVLPPPEPADRVAMRALDRLQEADYIGRGEYQLHYLMLTEILKGYIEGRFGIPALERTTDELRLALLRAESAIAPLKPTEVVRFLQQCDLVKFARFAPPPSEASAAVEQAREMVRATTPVEAEEQETKGQDPKDRSKKSGSKGQPESTEPPQSEIPTEPGRPRDRAPAPAPRATPPAPRAGEIVDEEARR